MLCLHGEKCYVGSSMKNGKTYWYCPHPVSSCHFKCTEDDAELYDKAVKEFLATKQERPKCCAIKSTLVEDEVTVEMPHLGRRYAKMKVVTDTKKESFGRPFFVCPISKPDQRCNYFVWGDKIIVESPLCEHGKPSRLSVVKKEGPNKDRKFFACAEQRENRCDFFEWFRGEPEDPLLPGSIVLFSNPPSYKYTVKKTGAMFTSTEKDRKKAYDEFAAVKSMMLQIYIKKCIRHSFVPNDPIRPKQPLIPIFLVVLSYRWRRENGKRKGC